MSNNFSGTNPTGSGLNHSTAGTANPVGHTHTTTGSANPVGHTHTTTGSANPVGHTHTTTGTANPTTTGGSRGETAGEGLKGMFAKGHGIGESIRGNINSAIDGFTGDNASLAKNEQVAQGGEREFRTGQFEKKGTTDKAL